MGRTSAILGLYTSLERSFLKLLFPVLTTVVAPTVSLRATVKDWTLNLGKTSKIEIFPGLGNAITLQFPARTNFFQQFEDPTLIFGRNQLRPPATPKEMRP